MSEKLNTKDRIVDAAKRLIYHHGYTLTSYGMISKETGIAKGNIQYHFNSKEDLLKSMIDRRLGNINTTLDYWVQNSADAHGAITKFLTMVSENAPDLARYGCPMGSLNDELGKDAPHLQQYSRQMLDTYLSWLQTQFSRQFETPVAHQYAEQMLSMTQGASILSHGLSDPTMVERQCQNIQSWLDSVFGL